MPDWILVIIGWELGKWLGMLGLNIIWKDKE